MQKPCKTHADESNDGTDGNINTAAARYDCKSNTDRYDNQSGIINEQIPENLRTGKAVIHGNADAVQDDEQYDRYEKLEISGGNCGIYHLFHIHALSTAFAVCFFALSLANISWNRLD